MSGTSAAGSTGGNKAAISVTANTTIKSKVAASVRAVRAGSVSDRGARAGNEYRVLIVVS